MTIAATVADVVVKDGAHFTGAELSGQTEGGAVLGVG